MCGRFSLATPTDVLLQMFDVQGDGAPTLSPRYNIAPTQDVAAIRLDSDSGARRMDMLHWGLIPFWAKDPSMASRMINARAETVAEKPAFRAAFKQRRCLIPADGFYEWQKREGGKQPFHFQLDDGRPMALAGLWERWASPDGGAVESCTILTTSANDVVRPVHHRMPVILDPSHHELWLDPDVEARGPLEAVLQPFDASRLTGHPVSTYVNAPRNDGPACVEPIEP